jgi:hypothetical protein
MADRRRWPWAAGVPVEGTEQPLRDDYVYALRDEDAYLQADDEKPQIVEPFDPASIVCQFCGKSYEQVSTLFEASAESGIPTPQPSRHRPWSSRASRPAPCLGAPGADTRAGRREPRPLATAPARPTPAGPSTATTHSSGPVTLADAKHCPVTRPGRVGPKGCQQTSSLAGEPPTATASSGWAGYGQAG